VAQPTYTAKGLRTRQRLLESGRAVLEERGYFEATVGDIAGRADVALGSFYRYFGNKDRLFLLLLEELVEKLYASTGGSWRGDDTQAALKATTRRYLESYYEERRLIAALLQMAAAVPECAALWWELRTRTHARMAEYLRLAVPQPEGRAPMLASALGSMVERFAHHWFVEAERLGRETPTLDEAADVLASIWYGAVYREMESK
jgi:AcrR family transcriptional regulator